MTVSELPLIELARRCREETLRFLRGEERDDAFCFEIFQRAVVDRDDDAWEAIVAQYRGIVLAYVSQHTAAGLLRESDDYWINRAFQRFWAAVGADRFGRFPDLPAAANAERSVLGKLSGQQLWDAIKRELHDEAEERVVFLSFARDLKPAEIAERHPDLFADVADVYRIKRNVIERLRRSAEIRAFLPSA